MNGFFKSIDKFLFTKISQNHLDIIRILFFGCLFLVNYRNNEVINYSSLDAKYWNPSGIFNFLSFLAPPNEFISIFIKLWKLSLLMCSLGFLTKLFKILAAVTGVIGAGYCSNFYLYPVEQALTTLTVPLFVFTGIGAKYSIDSFFSRSKTVSELDAWPLRIMQVIVVTFWFGSGIQKIRLSGLDWVLVDHLKYSLDPGSSLIWGHISGMANSIVLLAELICPIVFMNRIYGKIILLVLFVFHIFTIILIKIPIYYCAVVFILWLVKYKDSEDD
jgi:hypothetical protein